VVVVVTVAAVTVMKIIGLEFLMVHINPGIVDWELKINPLAV
jgi:hypothetical protein